MKCEESGEQWRRGRPQITPQIRHDHADAVTTMIIETTTMEDEIAEMEMQNLPISPSKASCVNTQNANIDDFHRTKRVCQPHRGAETIATVGANYIFKTLSALTQATSHISTSRHAGKHGGSTKINRTKQDEHDPMQTPHGPRPPPTRRQQVRRRRMLTSCTALPQRQQHAALHTT